MSAPIRSVGREKRVATAIALLSNFGSDVWNAELYESLSLAARLSAAVKSVKSHAHSIKVSYLLWKINGHVAKFFQEVDDVLAGRIAAPTSDEPPTAESIQKSIRTLVELGMSLNAVYEEARRKRILNNSMIAGPIAALRAHAEQFFELAEWFDLVQHGEEVEKIFASANEQRSRGEVHDLSQV